MSILDALLAGLDEARRRLGQTVLSLLGLVLGTASVVTVLSLFGGQSSATREYLEQVGGVGTMIARDRDMPLSPSARELASPRLTYRDAVMLRDRAASLDAVAPGWASFLTYRAGDVRFPGQIIGTVPDYARINPIEPMVGRFLTDLDVALAKPVLVLGWKFADSLFVGRPEAALGRKVELDGAQYTVVGVLEREYFQFVAWGGNALEYRNERAYAPITTAFVHHAGRDDRLSFLTLRVDPRAGMPAARDQVRSLLYQSHGVEDFDIQPPGAQNDGDTQFLMLFNFIFLVVGVVSLFAGGVVIANILLASVVERIREFGTMMALGATGMQVFLHVLAQVLVVSVIGGVAGLAIGTGLTGLVSLTMKLPAVVEPWVAGVALATSLLVGITAGLYPAFRVARLTPVEALRYG